MDSKLKGVVTILFIRAGISKTDKPYAMFANGREQFFVNVSAEEVDMFKDYKENDEITLEVEQLVGSNSVKILAVHS